MDPRTWLLLGSVSNVLALFVFPALGGVYTDPFDESGRMRPISFAFQFRVFWVALLLSVCGPSTLLAYIAVLESARVRGGVLVAARMLTWLLVLSSLSLFASDMATSLHECSAAFFVGSGLALHVLTASYVVYDKVFVAVVCVYFVCSVVFVYLTSTRSVGVSEYNLFVLSEYCVGLCMGGGNARLFYVVYSRIKGGVSTSDVY